MKDSEFESVFFQEQYLKAREKLGEAPLGMKCLSDKQVCHQIGDANDKVNLLMRQLQEGKYLFYQSGYDGSILKAKAEVVQNEKNITECHSQ